MATPISEQIAVIVRSRLAAISTDSGYETTTAGVIRPVRVSENNPKDYEIYVTQGTQLQNEPLSCPGNPPSVAWDFPFLINAILRPSETLATAADTLKNIFAADVYKSLTSVASWHTFGGLAINSKISTVEQYEDTDGSTVGFKTTLIVTYRVAENDPYTVRA
jgi:hypothetical protein